MNNNEMKIEIEKIAAVLQIAVGALLLSGTVCLTGSAYRTIREESGQLSANLAAAADALESARGTYAQSATNLFALTGTMDDVGENLDGVAKKISDTGKLFEEQSDKIQVPLDSGIAKAASFILPIVDKFQSIAEWCKNSGEKLQEIGRDVSSVAGSIKEQGKAIEDYRDNGHEKSLAVMAETAESLRHAEAILNGASAKRWCGFVCILGLCVSLLFFANGLLLFLFAKAEQATKAIQK